MSENHIKHPIDSILCNNFNDQKALIRGKFFLRHIFMVHTENNKKLIGLIFAFFFLINIASSGGHFDWWDGMEAFFVTESMVLKHTAKLDPSVPSIAKLNFDINYTVNTNKILQTKENPNNNNNTEVLLEPVYTVRSLMLSAAAVPFYYAAMLLSVSPIAIIGLFVNSLFISLTCVVIFCFSLELNRSKKISLASSVIFGVCSFVWPYNTTFWVQPLQALTLILSAFFIFKSLHYNQSFICHYILSNSNDKRKGHYFASLGGLFLGLSVFAHPTSIIVIPGFLVYSFIFIQRRNKNTKAFFSFLIVLGIVLFLAGAVNYARFGTFTEFGYGSFSSLAMHDGWRGLIGLIISPGAGLLIFFPMAILLPLGFKYMYNQNKGLLFLFAFIIIIHWIYVGTLSFNFEPFSWSGGVAWGPRYFIPILPFVTLIIGSIFTNLGKKIFLKALVVSLGVAGFTINLFGTLIWDQYGIMYGWQREGLAAYPNSLDMMTWNPIHSPIILHVKAFIDNYVSGIQPDIYINTSWNWVAYGLAPCSVDLYVFCKFGITSIVALIGFTSFIAFLLMKETGLSKGILKGNSLFDKMRFIKR
ncbi:MAG: hypothetical protein H0X50_11310 [Nitrosopumilus sp.]|nr:hypothetical protein [Nitrosopumilus sp.]